VKIDEYKNLPVVTFVNKEDFYTWLGSHNETQQPFWLRFYKKASGKAMVAYTDTVDVALCWGWIDGLLNKYDEESYVVRFTPRRKKSVWSKINIEKVAKLTAEGKMQPSGIAQVEAAKADGRWDAAYAGSATIELPTTFIAKLDKHITAKEYYNSLTKSEKYPYAFKLATTVGKEKLDKLEDKLIQTLEDKSNS
jgi:uncharacterized protein YdeI (YjbR/CyaY-like superfamily)